jgi:hypothetical protein
MAVQGKGWFIWQVPRCEGGNAAAIADQAVASGATHVLMKVAEKTFGFGYDAAGRDLVSPVVAALRPRGVQAWGWHYVYGDNPTGEANIAVKRVSELKLDGYVIDAETEYKRAGMASAARTFMSVLRAGIPNTLVALSTFRYPSLHPEVPYAVFLEKCDIAMPQVYWEMAHNPEQQLQRSFTEYNDAQKVGYVRPFVPTGAAYGVGGWRATADDITKFYTKAMSLGLAAANLYSWDYARSAGNTSLWEAGANFNWPVAQPPAPPAQQDLVVRFMAALNSGDTAQVLKLYQANAGHVTGKRTVVGVNDIAKYYYDLLGSVLRGATFTLLSNEGEGASRRFKWTAAGPTGTVADGDDTLGIREGLIQYHYTYFNVKPR